MLMDKKELRTLIAQNKKETSRAAILDLSGPILRRLAVHPRFIAARTVLLYHSLPDEVIRKISYATGVCASVYYSQP